MSKDSDVVADGAVVAAVDLTETNTAATNPKRPVDQRWSDNKDGPDVERTILGSPIFQ